MALHRLTSVTMGVPNVTQTAEFAELGADTVIIRPDFYVYAATDAATLGPTLSTLASQLSTERILQS